jgi:hypothetical protein
MQTKNTITIVLNILFATLTVVVALYLQSANSSNMQQQVFELQQQHELKLINLKSIANQTKIQDIDLLENIKKVKGFFNSYNYNKDITMRKEKLSARGMNYLVLANKASDMLWLLLIATPSLKIDINELEFMDDGKLTTHITILGK